MIFYSFYILYLIHHVLHVSGCSFTPCVFDVLDTFNTNLWEVIILPVYETLLWKGIFELLQLLSYNFSICII